MQLDDSYVDVIQDALIDGYDGEATSKSLAQNVLYWINHALREDTNSGV